MTEQTSNLAQKHHQFSGFCETRAKYREGRHPTAVKVYTISSESVYLLVQNVPSVGIAEELRAACEVYGIVLSIEKLTDYPREQFTDVYQIKFDKLESARAAKRKLDNSNFYGGLLHICYAPEFESLLETREKLLYRRRRVSAELRRLSTSSFPSISAVQKPSCSGLQQSRASIVDDHLSDQNGFAQQFINEQPADAAQPIDDRSFPTTSKTRKRTNVGLSKSPATPAEAKRQRLDCSQPISKSISDGTVYRTSLINVHPTKKPTTTMLIPRSVAIEKYKRKSPAGTPGVSEKNEQETKTNERH